MARVNIQVDLKESDFLDKAVKKELEGVARGIARDEMAKELAKELERLVDSKIAEAKKSDYYNSIAQNVTRIVATRLSADVQVDTKEVDRLITEKVEKYLDNRMRQFGGIEQFIQNYINQSIKSLISK